MMKLYETFNEHNMFVHKKFQESSKKATERIEIDPSREYQSIDGFGASFTDSSAYLIDKILGDEDKDLIMNQLFDSKNGIGLSVLRNPMGSSDFARYIYSYNDQKERHTDLDLIDFSIAHDEESILPLTKWAMSINPSLKLFSSPWSAPGWMKDSYNMVGGKLCKKYYKHYANYFVKYIQSYQKMGIPVYAVTPQNEPLFVPKNYPGMEMLAHEQVDFVKNHLKPALVSANLPTKIFGYDHNWDRIDYAYDILDDAGDSFDGIAWHWYGGNPINQTRVNDAYPSKEVHFSEGSGGEWIPEFEPAFSNLMKTGIEILRNHSKTFILWNIALDENNGPVVPGFGRSTCRGLLKINQQDKSYEYTLDYYGLAHFSKHLKPGSKRIYSQPSGNVKNVVFKNTINEIVVILFNDSKLVETIGIDIAGYDSLKVDLRPKSAVTLVVPAND